MSFALVNIAPGTSIEVKVPGSGCSATAFTVTPSTKLRASKYSLNCRRIFLLLPQLLLGILRTSGILRNEPSRTAALTNPNRHGVTVLFLSRPRHQFLLQ